MKNLFIVFTLIAALFTACNKAKTAKTVIDGKIANFKLHPDYNHFTLTVADFGGYPTTYKATVKPDGTFKIYFDQYIAQDVSLTPLVQAFITHPGDSVHIDMDYAAYGDVKFSGDREETNTALTHYVNEYYSNFNLSEINRNFASQQDKSDYQQVASATRAEMMHSRGEFIDKYQPNDEVLTWSKNYVNLCYYQTFGSLFNSYVIANKVPVSKAMVTFKNFVNSIDQEIYNTTLLNSDSYKIYGYLMPHFTVTNDNNKLVKNVAQAVGESNRSPIVKQLLIGGMFYSILKRNEIEAIDQNRKIFDLDIKEPFIKAPLNKFYAQVKQGLANPKLASDAIIKNIAAGSAKNLIDAIKAQNKGKVTYMDFWATWCGPGLCKREVPFSKKLMEKYKGKDVSFVFVCLDSSRDTWKANLAEMQLTGNQFFFDPAQSSEIKKGFKINGIPRYVIINKEGTITDIDATRPSDPITIAKLDRLLN